MERAKELADILIAASPARDARETLADSAAAAGSRCRPRTRDPGKCTHPLHAGFQEGLASFLERESRSGRAIQIELSLILSGSRKHRDIRMIEYHDAAVRVRYAETDQMGVVYHANYLIWFEVGR